MKAIIKEKGPRIVLRADIDLWDLGIDFVKLVICGNGKYFMILE